MCLKNYSVICLLLFSIIPQTVSASSTETEAKYELNINVVYINRGDRSLKLDAGDLTWNIFMNNSWQTVFLLDVNWPYTSAIDEDGNPIIVLDVPEIQPGKNITMKLRFEIIENPRDPPALNISSSGTLDDIPKLLIEQYCTASDTWQTNLNIFRNLANSIWNSVNRSMNALEVVNAIGQWVGRHISYPKSAHEYPWYPNETYYGKEGDCDDQANLFITLCRILEIPAYLQAGCLYDAQSPYEKETSLDGTITTVMRYIGYHGWAVVFVPPWGWLAFDLTMGYPRTSPKTPFAGITLAPVYSVDTIQLLNVTKSDWAGEAREYIQRVKESNLSIYEEESLTPIPLELPTIDVTSGWIPIVAFALTAVTILGAFGINVAARRHGIRKNHFRNEFKL